MESLRQGSRRRKPATRAGYTLMEMLAYVAVLAVIVNLCLSAFIMCTRLSALGTVAVDRMWALDEIRAEFTDAVHASRGAVAGAAKYQSSAECLVLEQPAAAGPDSGRYVVFGKIGAEPRLSKLTFSESQGKFLVEGFKTYPVDLASVRFEFGPGEVSSPTDARLLTVELCTKYGSRKSEPVRHRFSASPRCTGSGK